jgi:type II secretory pathway component PulF
MPLSEPSPPELEPIDRFHDELKSLVATGIGVNLGLAGESRDVPAVLERFRAALAVRVKLGQTLEQAIAEEASLSPRYRAAAMAWVRFDSPAVVLEAVADSSARETDLVNGIRLSLAQTALIVALMLIGLALAAVWLSPRMEGIYGQLARPIPPSLQWLVTLRDWLPVWATGAAVVFVLGAIFARSIDRARLRRLARWLPMVGQRDRFIAQAHCAQYMSSWLQRDLPLEDGLALAQAFATHDASTGSASEPLGPLLAWAIHADLAGEPRWAVLRAVAEVYDRLAETHLARWVTQLPWLTAIAISGLIVLAYGLSIFLPLIDILKAVTVPGSR